MLMMLGRAAGLTGLTLATVASGPCGSCNSGDECATLGELVKTREKGLADSAGASASTAGTSSELALNRGIAEQWNGSECPTVSQYQAIVELKFPGRYSNSSVTTKDLSNDKCCYHVADSDCSLGGRPFLVHGEPRIASVMRPGTRPPEASHVWLTDAQAEHASVAAFARLSLQLLSLGAPAELVRDAQLASLDELRHADFFFDLASRDAGSLLRPGPLPVAGALDDLSLAGLVESNLLEGCIGETLAAEHLRERARLVNAPGLKAALLDIAEDETRHAALAFRILAWCRDTAPELTRQVLQRVLAGQAPRQRANEAWQHVLSPLLGALC